MDPSIDKALRNLLNDSLNELEQALNSDVLSYYGPIVDGQENAVLNIVEDLAKDPNKKEEPGGSSFFIAEL